MSSGDSARAKQPRSSHAGSASTTTTPGDGGRGEDHARGVPHLQSRHRGDEAAAPAGMARELRRRSRRRCSRAGSARRPAAARSSASGATIGMRLPGRSRPCLSGLRSATARMSARRRRQRSAACCPWPRRHRRRRVRPAARALASKARSSSRTARDPRGRSRRRTSCRRAARRLLAPAARDSAGAGARRPRARRKTRSEPPCVGSPRRRTARSPCAREHAARPRAATGRRSARGRWCRTAPPSISAQQVRELDRDDAAAAPAAIAKPADEVVEVRHVRQHVVGDDEVGRDRRSASMSRAVSRAEEARPRSARPRRAATSATLAAGSMPQHRDAASHEIAAADSRRCWRPRPRSSCRRARSRCGHRLRVAPRVRQPARRRTRRSRRSRVKMPLGIHDVVELHQAAVRADPRVRAGRRGSGPPELLRRAVGVGQRLARRGRRR